MNIASSDKDDLYIPNDKDKQGQKKVKKTEKYLWEIKKRLNLDQARGTNEITK